MRASAVLYESYVNCNIIRKSQRKCRKFPMVWVSNRNTIHNPVGRGRTTGVLVDRKLKYQHQVLTDTKLDEVIAQLEQSSRLLIALNKKRYYRKGPCEPLLNYLKYSLTAMHSLEPCDSIAGINFCNQYAQSLGTFKN